VEFGGSSDDPTMAELLRETFPGLTPEERSRVDGTAMGPADGGPDPETVVHFCNKASARCHATFGALAVQHIEMLRRVDLTESAPDWMDFSFDDVEVVEKNEAGSSTDAMADEKAPTDVVVLNGDTPVKDSNVQVSETVVLVDKRMASRLALLQEEEREARAKLKGFETRFDSIRNGVIDALNAEGPQACPDDDLVDGLIEQHISS